VLLGFDFDGTLAPIVVDPKQAQIPIGTRRLLEQLSRLFPCAVISGRSVEDVRARLENIRLLGVVGNHGLEPLFATDEVARTVRKWRKQLTLALAGYSGVYIEDKTYSLAVHYRRSRHKRAAREGIRRVIGTLHDVRSIGGKQVVNLVPLGAPHKGLALERERERVGCDTAFFIGDDETDEDVFALDRPGRMLTVRVGKSSTSGASYYVRSRTHVDQLLRRFIDLRRRSGREYQRFAQ
jgi:trehalose 6-phosphate phosphatase